MLKRILRIFVLYGFPLFHCTVLEDIDIQVSERHGIRINIGTDESITAFYFWANINEPSVLPNKAKIQLGTFEDTGGEWIIDDEDIELSINDVIYYMVAIRKIDGSTYKRKYWFKVKEIVTSFKPSIYEKNTPIENSTFAVTPSTERFNGSTMSIVSSATTESNTYSSSTESVSNASGAMPGSTPTISSESTTETTTRTSMQSKPSTISTTQSTSTSTTVTTTTSTTPKPYVKEVCTRHVTMDSDDVYINFYSNNDISHINPTTLSELDIDGCKASYKIDDTNSDYLDIHIYGPLRNGSIRKSYCPRKHYIDTDFITLDFYGSILGDSINYDKVSQINIDDCFVSYQYAAGGAVPSTLDIHLF